MVSKNVLAASLIELDDRIGRVRSHCPPTVTEFHVDRDAIDIVSYNLMLAVQSCADIASHLIAGEGWPAATSLAGAFVRLRDEQVISTETADALCRAAALRNFVAHGYASDNPAMIHAGGHTLTANLETFGTEVTRWLLRPKS